MKETTFEISERTYIRITKINYFITINFIGKIQGMNIVLEPEAQRLIEELSRIPEGEE